MRSLFASLLCVFSLLCSVVFADGAKIAVVDFSEIEEKSLVTLDLRKQIADQQSKLNDYAQKMQKEVEKQVQAFEKSKSVLSGQALEKKRNELSQGVQKIEQEIKNRATKLDEKRSNALSVINDEIKAKCDEILKSQKYDMIVPSNSVISHSSSIANITSDVVSSMNKSMPSMSVNWDIDWKK